MTDAARSDCLDRIGMAKLAKLAFDGADLRPMWAEVSARLLNGEARRGRGGMDLSLVAQLLGHKETGLSIQQEVLASAPPVPFAVSFRKHPAHAGSGAGGGDRHGQQHARSSFCCCRILRSS